MNYTTQWQYYGATSLLGNSRKRKFNEEIRAHVFISNPVLKNIVMTHASSSLRLLLWHVESASSSWSHKIILSLSIHNCTWFVFPHPNFQTTLSHENCYYKATLSLITTWNELSLALVRKKTKHFCDLVLRSMC